MTGWPALAAELARWRAAGRQAEFWWRDDDAGAATPALGRLLELRAELDVPLALAVIPVAAAPDLTAALDESAAVAVLQHGAAHRNHAAPGAAKMELCTVAGRRSAWHVAAELAEARTRLLALLPAALPVLVPPWNRVEPALLPLLPGLGYGGISGWKARPARAAAPGLVAVNAHIDIIDWPGTRGFIGEAAAIDQAVGHLAAKREGRADAAEPTGLLTHHLVHDKPCRAFIRRFVAETRAAGGEWRDAETAFFGDTG